MEAGSIDIATLIVSSLSGQMRQVADDCVNQFCLSALHPDEWAQAVTNIWTMLKPGGMLLFRDYGRNDLAQLRFKKERYMQ